jgi:hypothetical protein
VKADALVNCCERQLESDVPGSLMHLRCFRVPCLGLLEWMLGCVGWSLSAFAENLSVGELLVCIRESCRKAANVGRASWCEFEFYTRPQIRREYPLNLSISVSGGKETNRDSHSNCE